MNKAFIFFTAGCIGGLANSLVVWQFGQLGINASFGVAIAPSLSPAWLYPRIVWGGLWGLLFLLPQWSSRLFLKATILSLLPSLVQLFIVFPLKANKGVAGLELGLYTPALVLFFNWVWGIASAISIKISR
ncbi:MAG: hypothetical protein KBT50_07265 [Cycloclasticus sp.]|nr:hypothetical protein [Cycloclasticus sp.]MBQ0790403.1 hypothetical protein [Cycloclasticus sp.]